MAASVMAATSALRPAAPAISSTHSMLISVESMSKAISRKSDRRRGGVMPRTTSPGAEEGFMREAKEAEPEFYERAGGPPGRAADGGTENKLPLRRGFHGNLSLRATAAGRLALPCGPEEKSMNINNALSVLPMLLAALLLGGGTAFAVTRGIYRRKLRLVLERAQHMARVRSQTTELLLQARRQIDMLNKELEAARRLRAVAARTVAAPAVPPAHGAQAAREASVVVSGSGFADTVLPPPRGFADTLPLEAVPAPSR